MVQTAAPIADLFIGNWHDEVGGTASLFSKLDRNGEFPTGVFAESVKNPVGEVYVAKLGPLTDPGVDTGHVLRLGAIHFPKASRSVDLTVELRQGYVDESNQGTLIQSQTFTSIAGEASEDDEELLEMTITAVNAALITDYTDLSVRVVADEC